MSGLKMFDLERDEKKMKKVDSVDGEMVDRSGLEWTRRKKFWIPD
jgi:hypothetical protein